MSAETGKVLRLSRILHAQSGRAALVALDHGLPLGNLPGLRHPLELMRLLAQHGADGFLLSPGLMRDYQSVAQEFGRNAPAVILRLDWTNMWRDQASLGFAEGRTRPIGTVEDALRLGADGVLVYYFMGLNDPDAEADQVMRVAQVARDCERWGMPCVIEPMARGERVGENALRLDYLGIHIRQAIELGADLIKTDYSGDSNTFRTVLAGVSRPVFIAGGSRKASPHDTLLMAQGALAAGARGIFFGRNIFQFPQPERMMEACAYLIHEDVAVDEALAMIEGVD